MYDDENVFGRLNYLQDDAAWKFVRRLAIDGRMQAGGLDLRKIDDATSYFKLLSTKLVALEPRSVTFDVSNVWLVDYPRTYVAGQWEERWRALFDGLVDAWKTPAWVIATSLFGEDKWRYSLFDLSSYRGLGAEERLDCVRAMFRMNEKSPAESTRSDSFGPYTCGALLTGSGVAK